MECKVLEQSNSSEQPNVNLLIGPSASDDMETKSNGVFKLESEIGTTDNEETRKITEKMLKKCPKLKKTSKKNQTNFLACKFISKLTAKASKHKKENDSQDRKIAKKTELTTVESALLDILAIL